MDHWLVLAALSAAFAALTTILAKAGLKDVDADFATFVRTVLVSGILLVSVLWQAKWQNPLAMPRQSLLFLVFSALATGASWVCYFRALQVGDASLVASVDKLSLVLIAISATFLFGERLGTREWIGIALITAGVICISIKR